MRITKQELEAKVAQAQIDNSIGWLDKAKMESNGINANPMKLTGYIKPENPFRECQVKRPRW